jgi:hypothetical protein
MGNGLVVAVGMGSGVGGPNQAGIVVTSNDNGASWKTQLLPSASGLWGISGRPPHDEFVVGNPQVNVPTGGFLQSTDGANWTIGSLKGGLSIWDNDQFVYVLGLFDKRIWYAATGDGSTWSTMWPATVGGLYAIGGRGNLLVGVGDGVVAATDDNGATWLIQRIADQFHLRAVWLAEWGDIYVVGDEINPAVFRGFHGQ